MKISNLIQRSVMSCTTFDNLERAAQLMWQHDIGCLPVVDAQGHIAGMVTDRDVCVVACTQGTPLRSIPIANVMESVGFTCSEGDEVDAVENTMRQHRARRMPVVDDQGHPVGTISLGDLARATGAGELAANDVAPTLAAISALRSVPASDRPPIDVSPVRVHRP